MFHQRRANQKNEILKNYFRLSEFVSEERQATKENVERKQSRAAGEEEEDIEEVETYSEEEAEDSNIPYNPKNLPLGWDGKPIPYWLYKLHGLNISYSCEICGNQVYKGPKAFQRHFTVSFVLKVFLNFWLFLNYIDKKIPDNIYIKNVNIKFSFLCILYILTTFIEK